MNCKEMGTELSGQLCLKQKSQPLPISHEQLLQNLNGQFVPSCYVPLNFY